MSTLRNIPFEEAHVALEENRTHPNQRIARIPGVPAVDDLSKLPDAFQLEEWVTFQTAWNHVEASTDRYWLPIGLAVHTAVRVAPGVTVDTAYLYLFPPPEGMFDQVDGPED